MKQKFQQLSIFVNDHQVPVIIGAFVSLPIIILGTFFLFSKLTSRSSSELATVTPTPSFTVTPFVSKTVTQEPEDTPEPTATKKVTPSTTPKASSTPGPTSNPTNTPGPTSTPTKLANILFQSVNCVASGSAEKKKINDMTFTTTEVPTTSTCEIEFKNTEDVETGDITYTVSSDSDQKKVTVGKLKKDETKKVTEVVDLKKNTGSHYIKVLLNPDKTFSETNYDDNSYQANYIVQ